MIDFRLFWGLDYRMRECLCLFVSYFSTTNILILLLEKIISFPKKYLLD